MTTESRLRWRAVPHRSPFRHLAWLAALLLVAAAGNSTLGVAPAQAGKARSIKTEAKFVAYDAATKTITVKVKKPGKKPSNAKLKLKAGKEASFTVKPEGSVLTRTSVTLNGKRAYITDIPENKTINVYWMPDDERAGERFARKIDMILSMEELAERDAKRLEAEKAAGRAASID